MPERISVVIYEKEIIDMWNSGVKPKDIASILSVKTNAVNGLIYRRGLMIKATWGALKIDKETRSKVVSEYESGDSTIVLARRYGVSTGSITNWVRKSGGTIRPNTQAILIPVNDHAFDELIPDAAYWIGFLLADGSIRDQPSTPVIRCSLASIDEEHLRKLARFVGYDRKLYQRTKIQASGLVTSSHELSFSSKRIAEVLASYGVVPRKTFKERALRGIETSRDFWRGVIDGDGSVKFAKEHPRLILTNGGPDLIQQFRDYVISICPRYQGGIYKDVKAFKLTLSHSFAQTVIENLYVDACVSLDRKAETARYIIDNPYIIPDDWIVGRSK